MPFLLSVESRDERDDMDAADSIGLSFCLTALENNLELPLLKISNIRPSVLFPVREASATALVDALLLLLLLDELSEEESDTETSFQFSIRCKFLTTFEAFTALLWS
jgi:hypothetical protein